MSALHTPAVEKLRLGLSVHLCGLVRLRPSGAGFWEYPLHFAPRTRGFLPLPLRHIPGSGIVGLSSKSVFSFSRERLIVHTFSFLFRVQSDREREGERNQSVGLIPRGLQQPGLGLIETQIQEFCLFLPHG